MAARERRAALERHIGCGLGQAGGIDDLALDPLAIRFAGDRLDDEADKAIAMIGILEPRVRRDDRRRLEVRGELLCGWKRTAIGEEAGVAPVADKPGAVRQQLRDGGARSGWVEAADILPGRVIELELTLLAQLQDAACREALGMRGDTKAVSRCKLLAAREVRDA